MSAILDALRKLDREKSLRRGTTPDIGAEILKPGRIRSGKRPALLLAAVCILTAAATYGVILLFGGQSKPSVHRTAGAPEIKPAVPSVLSPPLSAPTPPRSTSTRAPSLATEPAAEKKARVSSPIDSASERKAALPPPSGSLPVAEPSLPEPPVSARTNHQPSPSLSPQEAVPDLPSASEGANAKANRTPETSAPATLTASGSERGVVQKAPTAAERGEILQRVPDPESEGPPPALRVSGIVWSEDSSQRVAVINGMPLSEGDSIEGVKVVQILPTRVRFLQNESPFEILLGSAAVVK